jgi:hypothetical protein
MLSLKGYFRYTPFNVPFSGMLLSGLFYSNTNYIEGQVPFLMVLLPLLLVKQKSLTEDNNNNAESISGENTLMLSDDTNENRAHLCIQIQNRYVINCDHNQAITL